MTKIILAGVFGIVTACALAGICDPPPAKPDASLDWGDLATWRNRRWREIIDIAVILSPEEVGKYHPYDIDNYYLPGSNLKEWVIPSLEEGKSLSVPFLFIKGVNGGLAP